MAPVLLSLFSLEQYKKSEIQSAILNANWFGVWESNGSGSDYDYDDSEVDENGDIATELESNVIRYAPENKTLKQISSNHPNSNIGAFLKSIVKSISGSLGFSYNKIASDY